MRRLIDPTPVAKPPPAHPFRSFTMSKSREPEAPEFFPRVPRSPPEPPGPPGRPLFREHRSRCQLLFSLFLQQLRDLLATPPKEAGFYSTNPNHVNRFFTSRPAVSSAALRPPPRRREAVSSPRGDGRQQKKAHRRHVAPAAFMCARALTGSSKLAA